MPPNGVDVDKKSEDVAFGVYGAKSGPGSINHHKHHMQPTPKY